MRRLAICFAVALTSAVALPAQGTYVPNRVYAGRAKAFVDFETLVAQAARADVVFVGEQHDDVNTHRLELALLEGILRRHGRVVLSLEMFERDVAEPLAHFSMGHIEESEFLAAARPWPDYARDYKPLVDLALAHDWPVVAANVPREIAAAVSAGGLAALQARPERERAWFAKDLQCEPRGDYFARFQATMTGHTGGRAVGSPAPAMDAPTVARYYASQCLKDETMAESIAQAQAATAMGTQRAVVVHVTGSFHADYGEGTVERVRRRLPGKSLLVVTLLPTADLDAVKPDKDTQKLADYVVYTYRKPEPAK